MKKQKKKCQAHVEENNARCRNSVFLGNYCWHHYPRILTLSLIVSVFLGLLTNLLTLFYSESIVNVASKVPHFRSLDKKNQLFQRLSRI